MLSTDEILFGLGLVLVLAVGSQLLARGWAFLRSWCCFPPASSPESRPTTCTRMPCSAGSTSRSSRSRWASRSRSSSAASPQERGSSFTEPAIRRAPSAAQDEIPLFVVTPKGDLRIATDERPLAVSRLDTVIALASPQPGR